MRPVLDLLPLVANNDRVEALTADYRRLRSRLRDRRIHGTGGLSGSAERAAHETSFLEAVAALVAYIMHMNMNMISRQTRTDPASSAFCSSSFMTWALL